MILFLSDMHFGRGEAPSERAKEAALIDCLSAQADRVEPLYLVGDVFDGYIEYRHLVPKGFVRFQALLARWTDRGIPVTYLFGNHDSWHRGYFEDELGVRLVPEALDVTHGDTHLHLTHGDATASTHGLYSGVRPVMRHPVAAWMYRSLLPADLGLGIARWISRALHDEAPDPDVVEALRTYAREQLRRTPADLVVMGHSHEPALHTWPDGVYANVGNWYDDRSFVRLEEGRVSVVRWNGTRVLDIEAADV